MLAYRLNRWRNRAELAQTARPEPEAGDVLLQVTAAGACHSELHLIEWPERLLPWNVPFTLGHENAGRVAAVGAGVRDVSLATTISSTARGGAVPVIRADSSVTIASGQPRFRQLVEACANGAGSREHAHRLRELDHLQFMSSWVPSMAWTSL